MSESAGDLDDIDLIPIATNEDEPGVYAVLRSEATMDQAVEAVARSEGLSRDNLSVRPAKECWTWGDPSDHRGRLRLVWLIEEASR